MLTGAYMQTELKSRLVGSEPFIGLCCVVKRCSANQPALRVRSLMMIS